MKISKCEALILADAMFDYEEGAVTLLNVGPESQQNLKKNLKRLKKRLKAYAKNGKNKSIRLSEALTILSIKQ